MKKPIDFNDIQVDDVVSFSDDGSTLEQKGKVTAVVKDKLNYTNQTLYVAFGDNVIRYKGLYEGRKWFLEERPWKEPGKGAIVVPPAPFLWPIIIKTSDAWYSYRGLSGVEKVTKEYVQQRMAEGYTVVRPGKEE